MIVEFGPPEALRELNEFVIDASRAVAEVCPGVTPLQIVGPHRSQAIGRARSVLAALLRRHVFTEARPNRQNQLRIAICLGGAVRDPFPGTKSKPVALSLPMIGHLIGRHHSTLSIALRRGGAEEELEQADAILAAGYAEHERLESVVTFKSRTPSWRVA